MALGMEFLAREVHFYTIFELVYLKKQSAASEQLASILVKAYATLLSYLVSAAKYFDSNTLSK